MLPRIVVLGAGFGGLELSTALSDALGTEANVTLIDRRDSFVFGYSKLDLLFREASMEAVSMPYSFVASPGVRFLQETVTAIDPVSRRVTTDAGEYQADYLVVALGADYDYEATPGLSESNVFYSVTGAERLAGVIPSFVGGHAVIGVCGLPYKCTPAPSECALLLHGDLVKRGVRDACTISAEAAGRAVAEQLIAAVRGDPPPEPYSGVGNCYVEFGGGQVGAVRIDASGEPPPRGTFDGPSEALAVEKREFGASRRARWFRCGRASR